MTKTNLRNPSIPILMYHEIADHVPAKVRKYAVTRTQFVRHMQWLAILRYTSISLDELVANRSHGTPLPPRPVVITFDDGFTRAAEFARPVLLRHGFHAVFFVVAGLVGHTSTWLRRERGVEFDLFDWPTARALAADGFMIGSHTVTHPRLSEESDDRCRWELTQSRIRIEEEVGTPVRHAAYPFGSFGEGARRLVAEAGYASACSTIIGRSTAADDRFALRRIPVNGTETLIDFVWRLQTGITPRSWLGTIRAARSTPTQDRVRG